MGCFNSKLRPLGVVDNPLDAEHEAQISSAAPIFGLSQESIEQCLHGAKLYGLATSGDAALLFSRLVISRGHILAAVFEGHVSPSAAEYCRSHCWDAFVQANASRQQSPAAAALRALDRGFLTSSKHSLESRLASGCSATLLHVDIAARTATVATVGAHGAVALGSAGPRAEGPGTGGDGAVATAVGREQRYGDGRGARGTGQDARGNGMEQGSDKGQQLSVLMGQQALNRFTTLEAPSADCRRGLSGLVDLVHSALSPPVDVQATTQSASPVVAGTAPLMPLPPPGLPLPAPEPSNTSIASGGSGHGGTTSFMRRMTGASAAATLPQALGFGCAKDALLVAAFENAGSSMPHAHAPHLQAPSSAIGGRFAALSRMHCGCDVRVSSRTLVAGDECLVLLAGCGGTGGRAGAGRPPVTAAAAPATASISSGGGGGIENGGGTGAGSVRSAPAANSGQVGSSPLPQTPSVWGPAGALSAADAVSLAHELSKAASKMAADGDAAANAANAANAASNMTAYGFGGPVSDGRFDIVYDSYDSEATAIAAASAVARDGLNVTGPVAVSAVTPFLPETCPIGDFSAMAVASYAVSTALRNRGLEGPAGRASLPVSQADLSAACIAVWLDWAPATLSASVATAGSGVHRAQVGFQTPLALSMQPPPLQAALRWELLRAYCRFLIARRRRIIATWHALEAAVTVMPLPTVPAAAPQVASTLSLGGLLGLGAGGGGQGSYESCAGGGGATLSNRTASFTSRPPVMMEFVEELPTPAPSVTVFGHHNPYTGGAASETIADGVATAMGVSSAATGSSAMMAAANTAATLDELHAQSASAAVAYGIAGLVVEPMGSSEDLDEAVDVGDGGTGDEGGYSVAEPPRAKLAQRSFVMPAMPALSHRAMAMLGLRQSHSTPDLEKLATVSQVQGGDGHHWHAANNSNVAAAAAAANSPIGLTPSQAAEREAEAVAYAHGSTYYSSHASTSSAATTATSAGGGSIGGGGGSGCHFDWSLVMASVNQNSGPRRDNSAGHTPIPSAAANRLSTLGFNPEGIAPSHFGSSGSSAAFGIPGQGVGGDPHAAATGGYLSIHGSNGGKTGTYLSRGTSPLAQQAMGMPPLSAGPQGSPGATWASAAAGTSRNDGGGGSSGGGGGSNGAIEGPRVFPSPFSQDMQPPLGILIGRRSAGDSADGDGDAPDEAEIETELISEDLPQLRIESTAELAALMAEIIITDDGEVVRTGSGAGGAMPPPYTSRSHGLHHGLHGHHKGSRALSRQGSRGWQPRLAIVREDAREANTSTSCSQQLLAEGVRFTAISEERGSSQGSSGAGEHVQGSDRSSSSNSQRQSKLANSSNGSASNGSASNGTAPSTGSPIGSVEEQLAAFGAMGASVNLVPPTLPPAAVAAHPPPAIRVRLDAGVLSSAARGASSNPSAFPWSPWGAVTANDAAGYGSVAEGDGVGIGSEGTGSPISPVLAPSINTHSIQPRPSPSQLAMPLPLQRQPSRSRMQGAEFQGGCAGLLAEAAGSFAAAADSDAVPEDTVAGPTEGCGPWYAAKAGVSFRQRSGAVAEAASFAAGSVDMAPAVGVGALGQLPPHQLPAQLTAKSAEVEDVLDDLRPSLEYYPRPLTDQDIAVPAVTAATATAPTAIGPLLDRQRQALTSLNTDSAGRDLNIAVQCTDVSQFPSPAHLISYRVAAAAALGAEDAGQGTNLPMAVAAGTRTFSATAATAATAAAMDTISSWGHSENYPLQYPTLSMIPTSGRHQQSSLLNTSATRTRHFYGLAEGPPPAAAGSAARSCCSATAASTSPSFAVAATLTSHDVVVGGGAANTVTTLDRSWSAGSTSGPLYSLLHSTLSKGSMTAATSTAVPTPGCDSTQCSGGRLPTSNSFGGNDPSPSQASPLAAAPSSAVPAVAATASSLPIFPRSMLASQQDSIGFGSGGRDGAPVATATVLPSIPPEGTSSSAIESSTSFSVTLHAPRFSDWEPHATGIAAGVSSGSAIMSSSSGAVGTATATAATAAPAAVTPVGGVESGVAFASVHRITGGGYHLTDDSLSFPGVAMDMMGRPVQYMSHYTAHLTPYHQHRSSGLTPTRLSRPGFSTVEPQFGFFNLAAVDSQAVVGTIVAGGGGGIGQPQDLASAVSAVASVPAAVAGGMSSSGLRLDISPTAALTAGGGGAQSAALSRPLGGSFTSTMYGTYTGPSNHLPEVANAYDDGAATNRSSNISRSDASVWNSASAWTASTGRTTDMTLGGSNRRVHASTGGGITGGSSCMMQLPPGVALGGGLGGGDTSSLLPYNAAYSSVSGLLMTADSGAPGSNTQLLMQMVPGILGGGGAGGAGGAPGGGGGGGGGSNPQHSSQNSCSPRQTQVVPGCGTFGLLGGGGDGFMSPAQVVAVRAAQARVQQQQSTLYGTSLGDFQQAQQLMIMQQQRQMAAFCGDERGASLDRPMGQHAIIQTPRGLVTSTLSPAHSPSGGPAFQPQLRQQHQHQLHHLHIQHHQQQQQQHQQQQMATGAEQGRAGPRREMYEKPTGGLYDSGGQAQLIHDSVLDSASGCFLLGGGSTSNIHNSQM